MLKDKVKSLRAKIPRSFTLMLIPHSEQSIYRARIPLFLIQSILLLFIALSVAGYYFFTDYQQMKERMAELRQLRVVNEEQETRLKQLEEQTEKLKANLLELNRLEQNVRNLLKQDDRRGREELPSRSGSLLSRNSPRSLQSITLPQQLSLKVEDAGNNIGTAPAVQEKSAVDTGEKDWNTRYAKLKNELETLSWQFTDTRETLSALTAELTSTLEYLQAKPYGWPTSGRITSNYGYRRSPFTGRREFHDGLDIAAPYGTPIVATHSGTVVYTGYKWIYGRMVIIKNKKYGFTTVYSHASQILVKEGDKVKRGDVIAKVGNTGRSTGPHTHYEVHVNGVRVNPRNYLQ